MEQSSNKTRELTDMAEQGKKVVVECVCVGGAFPFWERERYSGSDAN